LNFFLKNFPQFEERVNITRVVQQIVPEQFKVDSLIDDYKNDPSKKAPKNEHQRGSISQGTRFAIECFAKHCPTYVQYLKDFLRSVQVDVIVCDSQEVMIMDSENPNTERKQALLERRNKLLEEIRSLNEDMRIVKEQLEEKGAEWSKIQEELQTSDRESVC